MILTNQKKVMTPRGGPSIDLPMSQFNQEKLWKAEIIRIKIPKQLIRILSFMIVGKAFVIYEEDISLKSRTEKDISYIKRTEIDKANVYL